MLSYCPKNQIRALFFVISHEQIDNNEKPKLDVSIKLEEN